MIIRIVDVVPEFQIQFQILHFHLILDSIRLVDDSGRPVLSFYKMVLILYPIWLKAQIVDAFAQLHNNIRKISPLNGLKFEFQ